MASLPKQSQLRITDYPEGKLNDNFIQWLTKFQESIFSAFQGRISKENQNILIWEGIVTSESFPFNISHNLGRQADGCTIIYCADTERPRITSTASYFIDWERNDINSLSVLTVVGLTAGKSYNLRLRIE